MTIFKNILYMARRFKWATALNLVGLIVAFAAFYVLMTQVIYQVTYNKGVDDYERIYRLESDFVYNEWQWSDAMCRPIADDLARLP
jgi:putative ABC transport system permease protein